MRNSLSHKHLGLRFRRWSRKNYAAFCSMGKYVMIGHLRNNIADASLGNIMPLGVFGNLNIVEYEDETEFRDTGLVIDPLLLNVAIIPSGYTVEYPAIRYTSTSIRKRRKDRSLKHHDCLYVFFVLNNNL